MAAFAVTGSPGSRKSALARELAGRGVPAIDPDAAALDGTAPAAVVADELLALDVDVEGRAGLLRCEPLAGVRSTVP